MHIQRFAENLLHRPNEPRMFAKQTKRLVICMCGECGARRTRFLAPDLLAFGTEDGLRLAAENANFLGREEIRKEQIAFPVEVLQLLTGQSHGRGLLPVVMTMCQVAR